MGVCRLLERKCKGMNKLFTWANAHKQVFGVAVCALCAVSIAGCGAGAQSNASGAATTEAATTQAASTEASAQDVEVKVSVTADGGWDSKSTPLIVHVSGDDVDLYHAVSADEPTATLTLPEGSYTVNYVTPVNADGSVFQVGGTQAVTLKADDAETNAINAKMKKLAPADTSNDKLGFTVDKLQKALKGGDDSLKGDAATKLIETFKTNVAANPNVTDDTKAKAAKLSA